MVSYELIKEFMAKKISQFVETLDLTCTSNKDCESFEDKKVEGSCRDGKCVCNIRRSEKEELVPCVPRVSHQFKNKFSHF